MTNGIIVTIIAFLVIAFMGYMLFKRDNDGVEYTTEIVTDESDPALQLESKCRTALLASILSVIHNVWDIELTETNTVHQETAMNVDMVTILDAEHSIYVLCDWTRSRIKVSCKLSDGTNPNYKPLLFRICLKIRNGYVDLNRFGLQMGKWYKRYYKNVIIPREDVWQRIANGMANPDDPTPSELAASIVVMAEQSKALKAPIYDSALIRLINFVLAQSPETAAEINDLFEDEDEAPEVESE